MSMQIIRTINEMQRYADELRRKGETLAFVPTMGFLHEGHATLMREGKKLADRVVVSIFVNPTQFGPNEDFEKYPRDFERDRAICEREGVAAIFTPEAAEMYPAGAQTWVDVTEVSQNHCGASRPGHFRGVATVVTKLFLAAKPHVALFGEKDYQQLAVIRQMVRDLNFDLKIVGVPTVREPDGLAMSSRNKYLSPDERQRALALSRGMRAAEAALHRGEKKVSVLKELVVSQLSEARAEIDYVNFVDADTLKALDVVENRAVILIAVRMGTTRLIDNATIVASAASSAAV
jgi:pantoate--beta-alanine ligase